jgi:hypothetical protein
MKHAKGPPRNNSRRLTSRPTTGMSTSHPQLNDPEWRNQAELLFNRLPEHYRRWFAGLLSLQPGWGGIEWLRLGPVATKTETPRAPR